MRISWRLLVVRSSTYAWLRKKKLCQTRRFGNIVHFCRHEFHGMPSPSLGIHVFYRYADTWIEAHKPSKPAQKSMSYSLTETEPLPAPCSVNARYNTFSLSRLLLAFFSGATDLFTINQRIPDVYKVSVFPTGIGPRTGQVH